ncbi:hypothetical protein [Pseudolysinimonas sp.]|uniref:hypothetical protein n=1 Tax=Pseudolysinimonas sp. TaxID=2680009 RepID=UPI003F7EC66E
MTRSRLLHRPVFTADDRSAGTVEKVTHTFVRTSSGETFPLADLDETYTVVR